MIMKSAQVFFRRKRASLANERPLSRVLKVYDLVALGVGSTLGVGIYVLAGQVAKDVAGPAVVVSFLIAAVVTALAGLSYGEFGARVPKAGSAYIYSYYTVGELPAFLIGWSLVLEYGIGAASVSRAISAYIDTLTGSAITGVLSQIFPLNHPFLSAYVDLLAMVLCLALSGMLAFGVKESSIINSVFTTINLGIVGFFIVAGAFVANFDNWTISKAEIPANVTGGEGGFLPFGWHGVLQGAALCFYGFIGFDGIASTGEEVHNPQKAIPLAIVISLGVILTCYLGVSTVLTLMLPYYLQDPNAPIPHVFQILGWYGAKWVITIGALFGLYSSLFGALFPLPRIIYAMSQDGLLFRWLGRVHSTLRTPLVATLVAGVCVALMAAFFNLQQLVGLNAIGTLLTYALVSACVLILRYENSDEDVSRSETLSMTEETSLLCCSVPTFRQLLRHLLCCRTAPAPTPVTSRLVKILLLIFSLASISLSYVLVVYVNHLSDFLPLCIGSSSLTVMVLATLAIARQPTSLQHLSFKMPLVPWAPCLSIFMDIYLMAVLDSYTWIRFAICIALGNLKFETLKNDRPSTVRNILMKFGKEPKMLHGVTSNTWSLERSFLEMYRGGELLETVDQTFAFLNDVSSVGGSISRGRNPAQLSVHSPIEVSTWNDRQPRPSRSKGWEPRYKSVRDMPGFIPETRPLRSQEWDARRRQEELINAEKQRQWDREKIRREAARKEAERKEVERVRLEIWREAERAKQQAREVEEQLRAEDARRQEEEEMAREEELRCQQEFAEDQKIRRWDIHPPQRTDSYEEEGRNWDVYPSASQDRLQKWQQQLHNKKAIEKNALIGNYVQPPVIPERNGSQLQHKSDAGSSLLKRTKHYLDAIERMRNGVDVKPSQEKPSNFPKPPEQVRNIPKPPPPPFPAPQPEPFIAERVKDFRNRESAVTSTPAPPPLPTYDVSTLNCPTQLNLDDIQYAKSTLKPIKKRIIDDNTFEPEPTNFKEVLERTLQSQLAHRLRNPQQITAYGEPATLTASGQYKTVKTLTKTAMKDNLEEISVAGPTKTSFRQADMTEQTAEALAKHRAVKKPENAGYGRVHLRRNPSGSGNHGPPAPADVRFSRNS